MVDRQSTIKLRKGRHDQGPKAKPKRYTETTKDERGLLVEWNCSITCVTPGANMTDPNGLQPTVSSYTRRPAIDYSKTYVRKLKIDTHATFRTFFGVPQYNGFASSSGPSQSRMSYGSEPAHGSS
ncbi:unnamed protein product [Aspergillus oryzae]|nr:unnamed protein product [Aspergillus oryzae]